VLPSALLTEYSMATDR